MVKDVSIWLRVVNMNPESSNVKSQKGFLKI